LIFKAKLIDREKCPEVESESHEEGLSYKFTEELDGLEG